VASAVVAESGGDGIASRILQREPNGALLYRFGEGRLHRCSTGYAGGIWRGRKRACSGRSRITARRENNVHPVVTGQVTCVGECPGWAVSACSIKPVHAIL